jgi:hypothetical protein
MESSPAYKESTDEIRIETEQNAKIKGCVNEGRIRSVCQVRSAVLYH